MHRHLNRFRRICNSFFTTMGLLCRIPIKFRYEPDFSLFGFFFPVSGIMVSGMLAGLYYILSFSLRSTGTIAFLLLFFQYILFNLFHFDGLLDCADACFYNTSIEKRLEILKDKTTGSFAMFSGSAYIFLKLYLLATLITFIEAPGAGIVMTVVFLAYPIAGRISGAMMPIFTRPASDPGLAELIREYPARNAVTGIILTLSVPGVFIFLTARSFSQFLLLMSPFAGTMISGLLLSAVAGRMTGGYTGDSIGLTIETGELAYLILTMEILGRLTSI